VQRNSANRLRACIQILDYGSGNLFSIQNSLLRVDSKFKVTISSDYTPGQNDGLVLPGVGSFSSAQRVLGRHASAIAKDVRENGMPVLGVCLGMQLMFEKSEEGVGSGLNFFEGSVVRFEPNEKTKVPHMGWNKLKITSNEKKSDFRSGVLTGDWVYFVHSYYAKAEDPAIVLATTKHGNQEFPSIIARENILGTQFHPEKSSKSGLKLLSNFARAVKSFAKK